MNIVRKARVINPVFNKRLINLLGNSKMRLYRNINEIQKREFMGAAIRALVNMTVLTFGAAMRGFTQAMQEATNSIE